MAPQFEWPQITISVTPSATTAYSMVADTPPGSGPKEGTMLPAVRITKILLSHKFGHQATVRTRNKKRFRVLAGGKAAEEFLTLWENLFLEAEETFNDMLHSTLSESVVSIT
jgi:hypothetical protein